MQAPQALRRAMSLALLLLPMSAPTLAQRGDDGDAGEYDIVQARYGTPEHNIDVTARLRELARRDRRFTMGNDTFGSDPDPGRPKSLRIVARGRNGQERSFDYPEGSQVDGAQFRGWSGGSWGGGQGGPGGSAGPAVAPTERADEGAYRILEARYGTANRNIDVTRRLQELARRDRSFRMGNSTFGADPDPGRIKTLRIFARGKNGQVQRFDFSEGSVVDGAQFTGWSRGDWAGGGGWGGGWGKLQIVSASYGAGRRTRDITARLRAQVRDDRLDVVANNDLAGTDPAPDTPKVLVVAYTLGGGKPQQARVDENGRLRLP